MASFTESFNQADGPLAGWGSAGAPAVDLVVVSNRCSTNNNTGMHAGLKSHGLNVSGDWQIDFDFDAPLVIGSGGAGVLLLSPIDFSGYGVYCSNAVHVQEFLPGGTHNNLTNDSRPGEGSGHSSGHMTFTHTAAGLFNTYLDGVRLTPITNTAQTAGSLCIIELQNINSPTVEAWMDNLVVQDFIGAPSGTAAPHRRRIPASIMRNRRR